MDATTIRVKANDLDAQFFRELKSRFGKMEQVEIKVQGAAHGEGLFSEEQFWGIIARLDWAQADRDAITAPAAAALAAMPLPAIYLFEDLLSEKLHLLDTRRHARSFVKKSGDGELSADEFLYARCAVVAEGREFFEKTLADPSAMPGDIDFEHLLGLAAEAYRQKTGREFDYSPIFGYETGANTEGWKK